MLGGMSSVRPRILLDCDPGHDDAVAMIVAAHAAELVGVTTVAGNAPLDSTTRNALIVRELLGIDVPVHRGADRPLLAEPKYGTFVHGESGMDGAELPEPTRPVDGIDAARFIVDTVRASNGDLWLVAVGPLTNIALAIRSAPDIVDRVAGISLMGGGTYGNRTPAAEFNIWADPEAAAIVFRSGASLTMAGLDLTHQFRVTAPRIADVRRLDGTLPAVLADLFDFFADNYIGRHLHFDGAPLHDPCAVLAVTHPELFEGTDLHVDVETSGDLTAGMTVIDRRNMRDTPAANCRVLGHIDHDAAWGVVVAALTG